jgi:PAS domain S-box-containing protein
MVQVIAARAGLAGAAGMSRFLVHPAGVGVAVAALLALFVVVPYHELSKATHETALRRADLLAEQAALRVQTFLNGAINAIATLTAREPDQTFRSEDDFIGFAADIYRAFPGIVAVNRVDERHVVAWVYPLVENAAARGADLTAHPQAAPALRLAEQERAPRMTPALTLLQGGSGFAVYIPRVDDRDGGFVNLAFRDRSLLQEVFPRWDDPQSALTIAIGGQDVFSLGSVPTTGGESISSTAEAMILNQPWQARVVLAADGYPSQSLLGIGLLLAAAVGLAVGEALRRRRATLEMQRRLSVIGENAPAVVYQRVLWPDGRITFPYVSQGITRLLGPSATAERIRDDPDFIWSRILPEDLDQIRESAHHASHAMVPWNEEFRMRRDDGRVIWLSGASRPHREARGTVVCDGILMEITERKQAELALARSEEQLRQLQRMEAIGQLTGGIAHDFNNLLMIILGNLDLAIERAADPAGGREPLRVAIEAAERGAELTRQLLAFARRQALMPRAVKVNELVRQVETMLRRTLGRGISIELHLAEALSDAFCDPAQLENALINLAVNARDAMPGGGVVRIATASRVLGDSVAAASPDVRPGEYVAISVADTGTGMPPEVKARAFEPFFTTKEMGHGTGLGLAMVYGFVKQSGGHIELESSLGAGTEITLFLPRADALHPF